MDPKKQHGRPQIRPGDPTEKKSITLPASMWARIDAEKGDDSASSLVRRALVQWWAEKAK